MLPAACVAVPADVEWEGVVRKGVELEGAVLEDVEPEGVGRQGVVKVDEAVTARADYPDFCALAVK